MNTTNTALQKLVLKVLSDQKAIDTALIPLKHNSDVADSVIITTGTSSRHIITLKEKVAVEVKKAGFTVLGFEGEKQANWIVLDLNSVIVHFFRQEVREYYDIEKIWQIDEKTPAKKPVKVSKEESEESEVKIKRKFVKSTTKKPAAKKTTAKKPAIKTSTAKSSTVKKVAVKKVAVKKTSLPK